MFLVTFIPRVTVSLPLFGVISKCPELALTVEGHRLYNSIGILGSLAETERKKARQVKKVAMVPGTCSALLAGKKKLCSYHFSQAFDHGMSSGIA